jgi:hypothetical protein
MAGTDAPDANARETRGSVADAFWLVLTIVNCALFLWLIPDKVLKADWFDVLSGKIAPWLATSVFVAGYTWWTDEILQFSRSRVFRALQVVIFVPLFLTEVPLITISAEITPPNAQLWIDGERTTRSRAAWRNESYLHDIQLVFKPHRFEVKPPDYWDPNHNGAQEIELGWRDMFTALAGRREFHWSIVWPVTFSAACSPTRIIAIRDGRDAFDNNYLATWALDQEVWPVAFVAPYGRLKWDDRGTFKAVEVPLPHSNLGVLNVTVRLPAGNYRFIALRSNAVDEAMESVISTRQQTFRIEFKHC